MEVGFGLHRPGGPHVATLNGLIAACTDVTHHYAAIRLRAGWWLFFRGAGKQHVSCRLMAAQPPNAQAIGQMPGLITTQLH